ncbi:MAG: hypothetical protein HYV16_15985 [Gammaproteobacteria bacterium]|nr:hypothetical protein [Gammaproteobacteria bacterium]
MLWFWSAHTAQELGLSLPTHGGRVRHLPESLFWGQRHATFPQLMALPNGFEGRHWKGGVLRASTWWGQLPSLEEWNAWLRQVGERTVSVLPVTVSLAYSDEPWSRLRASDWRGWLQVYRRELVSAACSIVLAAFVYELAALWRVSITLDEIAGSMALQDAGLQRILEAREQAESNARAIKELRSLRAPLGPLSLFARFRKAMPEEGWEIRQWQLVSRDRLEVLLHTADLDPEALVRTLEQSGDFVEVSVTLTGNDMLVRATLKPEAVGDLS